MLVIFLGSVELTSSVIDAVNQYFINAQFLDSVYIRQVPRYLARRSSWSKGSWQTYQDHFLSSKPILDIHRNGREAQVQMHVVGDRISDLDGNRTADDARTDN